MRAFLITLLGTYTPVMTKQVVYTYDTVTSAYITSQIDVVAAGVAGIDWLYILTAAFFLIVVYSFFRILGGVLCRTF